MTTIALFLPFLLILLKLTAAAALSCATSGCAERLPSSRSINFSFYSEAMFLFYSSLLRVSVFQKVRCSERILNIYTVAILYTPLHTLSSVRTSSFIQFPQTSVFSRARRNYHRISLERSTSVKLNINTAKHDGPLVNPPQSVSPERFLRRIRTPQKAKKHALRARSHMIAMCLPRTFQLCV